MTRMTRPDCAVMCNLINTHTHTHTGEHKVLTAYVRTVQTSRESVSPLSRLIRIFRKNITDHPLGGSMRVA